MTDDPKMPEPVAWTLQRELDAKQSTCRAHLWFSDPMNTSWAPLITTEAAQAYAEALAAQRVAQERERCAQVCEEEICPCCFDEDAQAVAEHLADAIRTQPPEFSRRRSAGTKC